MLSERRIKCLLLDYLLAKKAGKVIAIEVPFLSGKRWSDVVLITKSNQTIAFEIKSDRDSLRRMHSQLLDYVFTFNQVYVIFSNKFRGSPGLKRLPRGVGYGFVNAASDGFEFKRHALTRKKFNKNNLLCFLWRKDLSEFDVNRAESIDSVRRRAGRRLSLLEIKRRAVVALIGRYESRFKTFRREKSQFVQVEDLEFLTKTFGRIP